MKASRRAKKLSHLDASGGVRMVDVTAKPVSSRAAVAEGRLSCAPATIRLLRAKALPKGDALVAAKLAGIQAAKATSHLIPLCHPLALTGADVTFRVERDGIVVRSEIRLAGRTGVEMEALAAVAVAALTLYDMCKAADKGIVIGPVALLEKTGGKSGSWRRGLSGPAAPFARARGRRTGSGRPTAGGGGSSSRRRA